METYNIQDTDVINILHEFSVKAPKCAFTGRISFEVFGVTLVSDKPFHDIDVIYSSETDLKGFTDLSKTFINPSVTNDKLKPTLTRYNIPVDFYLCSFAGLSKKDVKIVSVNTFKIKVVHPRFAVIAKTAFINDAINKLYKKSIVDVTEVQDTLKVLLKHSLHVADYAKWEFMSYELSKTKRVK